MTMSFPKQILTALTILSVLSVLILTLFYLNIGPRGQQNGCIAAKEVPGFNSTLYSLENPRWRSELQKGINKKEKVAIPFYNYTSYTSYPLNINIRELVMNHKEGSQYTTPEMINVYPYLFITKPEVKCTNRTKLLIVIKSAPKNRRARQAIRDTWANEESVFGIKRVFALGKSNVYHNDVQQEIKTHKDILIIDYEDRYYMNTWKLRGALIWAENWCTQSDYVMLVDDDYYVATDLLLQQLEMIGSNNKEYLYMGWVNPRSIPFRSTSSKWYISPTDYPYDIYPPFVSAGSIVMSMNFVKDFIFASQFTKHIVFDDVFLAIVANKMGVAPINNKLFYTGKVEYWNREFWNTLTSHGYSSPSSLRNAWKCHLLLKNNGLSTEFM